MERRRAAGADRARRMGRLVTVRLRRLVRMPSTRTVLRTAVLLVLFVVLDRVLDRAASLPEFAYFGPVILLGWIRHLPIYAIIPGIGLAAAAAVLAVRHRSLGPKWDDFEPGPRIRMLVVLAALILTWVFSTYPYNAYFDRPHPVDRILLPVFLVLTAWRPVFVLPFLIVLMPIMNQFNHPIGGYSVAQPILLVHVLMLFLAVFVAAVFRKKERWSDDFIFLTCCLLAASFWIPGMGKLPMQWFARDQVALLLPATYANGWLGFLAPGSIETITQAVARANPLVKLFTLVAEAGALFCLWRASTMRGFLILWIFLHLGIFLLSGIFFWMWILIEAAILLLFFRGQKPELFSRHRFLTSIVVIAGGALWFVPENLAWRDVPATYTYRIEAEGLSGRTYDLSPRYFAPYDYQFTLSNFHYLVDAPVLMIVWGATNDARLIRQIPDLGTQEDVFAAERRLGRTLVQENRAERFEHFIRRTIGVKNREGMSRLPGPPAAPPQVWTFPLLGPRIDEPIREVTIHQITSFFDGRNYRIIRDRPVRTIAVQ